MSAYHEVRQAFRATYGDDSPNFMTPYRESFYVGNAGGVVCGIELSSGEGLKRGTELWGVTVIDLLAKKPLYELSQAFGTKDEAVAYIQKKLRGSKT